MMDPSPLPPPLPTDLAAWETWRTETRATLWRLLGNLPPRPRVPQVSILQKQQHPGYWLEELEIDNEAGEKVRAYCFLPEATDGESARHPAVLYCHWHGEQYDIGKEELLLTNAVPTAPGPALARLGYVVLGIDAPGFGQRNGIGPRGSQPKDTAGEMSAAKYHLWYGRTLWGMTLRDDLIALDYLCQRPEVDSSRVGVTGVSMGSTRAWWLMALDERLSAASCTACMTRYQDLIAADQLNAHGIYYYVPGMLQHFGVESILALAAPRALLFQTGDQDAGSPPIGIRHLEQAVRPIFSALGAEDHFQSILYPGVGHVCTPEMWRRTVDWLDRWLKESATP